MKYIKDVLSDEVITVVELRQLIGTGRICLLDARSPEAYEHGHIPGAVNLHPSRLERTILLSSGEEVPNQLCAVPDLSRAAREAGVSNDVPVCVYDEGGSYLAARLWWALDVAGHRMLRLLDGGFTVWAREVGAVSAEPTIPAPTAFVPSRTRGKCVGFPEVITAMGDRHVALCNTLPLDSYLHETIPGSLSFPYTETFADDNFPLLRSRHELAAAFQRRGITPRHHLICFCGIGYSASQLYVAARYAGFPQVSLYDGSMVDWCARGGELVPGVA